MFELLVDFGLFVSICVSFNVGQTFVYRLSIVGSVVVNDLGFESATFDFLLGFDLLINSCFLSFNTIVG